MQRVDISLGREWINTRSWDGNLEITAWDVLLDRKLIDGRPQTERVRNEWVHKERKNFFFKVKKKTEMSERLVMSQQC